MVHLKNPETPQVATLNPTVAVDTVNLAVTVVYLALVRLFSYAINARNVDWRERAVYCWNIFFCFRSFQTVESKMKTNKRNMLLKKQHFPSA